MQPGNKDPDTSCPPLLLVIVSVQVFLDSIADDSYSDE